MSVLPSTAVTAGLDPVEQLVKGEKEIMGECEGQAKRLVPTSDSFSCSCLQLLTRQIQFMAVSVYLTILCLKVSFFFEFEYTCHFPAVTAASPHLPFSAAQSRAGCPTGNTQLYRSPSLAQPSAFPFSFQTRMNSLNG